MRETHDESDEWSPAVRCGRNAGAEPGLSVELHPETCSRRIRCESASANASEAGWASLSELAQRQAKRWR